MKITASVLVCLLLSGCVSTSVIKEVYIKKDANGKVIETTEVEGTVQQGWTKGGQLNYLKNQQNDVTPVKVYY